MKFKTTLFSVTLLILLVSGLSWSRTLSAGSLDRDIPVYESSVLKDAFVILGKVTVQSAQMGQLMSEMKKRTVKYGGDAVVRYRVLERGSYPHVDDEATPATANSLVLPSAEGIIIKFDKQGHKEVDESSIVPVLE